MTEADEQTSRLPGDLAVVVPAYNPGGRLKAVLEGLRERVDTLIVVDDGSTDGGVDVAGDMPLTRIVFDTNRGKGHAILAGYRKALENPGITCVAVLDADGQHDPAELPRLYQAMRDSKADLLIGGRTFTDGNVPLRSRFGNALTVFVSALLLGTRLPDTQSGYRLASRRFLEEVLPGVEGGRYETEMELLVKAIRGGYTVKSEPIRTLYEPDNASSHFHKFRDSFLIYRKLFATAWKTKTRRS